MTQTRLSFSDDRFDPQAMTIAPSPHPAARETSALAAVAIQPKRATQNAQILSLITAAGDDGLSDPELAQMTGFYRASICARRRDLKSLIEPATRRYLHGGRPCTCWKRRSDRVD